MAVESMVRRWVVAHVDLEGVDGGVAGARRGEEVAGEHGRKNKLHARRGGGGARSVQTEFYPPAHAEYSKAQKTNSF